jgi:diguanylate cyclase (GGDEF)-like protein
MIAEKIVEQLHIPFDLKGNECSIGASIGISIFPRDGNTAESLLKASDMAMYEAKNKGRGRVCSVANNIPTSTD